MLRQLFTFLIMTFAGGCENKMIVEAKDVKFTRLDERQSTEGQFLRIEGLIFHSSLAVDHTEIKIEGDTVAINVFLTVTRKGLSGSFAIDVPIAPNIKTVVFGPSFVQIWPKDNSK